MYKFKKNDLCNFNYQNERLVYLGHNHSGIGYWHQFAKISEPTVVWSEVTTADLELLEATEPGELTYDYVGGSPLITAFIEILKEELSLSPTLPKGAVMDFIVPRRKSEDAHPDTNVIKPTYEVTYSNGNDTPNVPEKLNEAFKIMPLSHIENDPVFGPIKTVISFDMYDVLKGVTTESTMLSNGEKETRSIQRTELGNRVEFRLIETDADNVESRLFLSYTKPKEVK
jgi:hypothetical protein